MTASVREEGRFERLVTFRLTEGEIDAAKSGAARRISQDLKLKGFRPGKAPRPVVEAAVGSNRLRTEAIEDLLPGRVGEILDEVSLVPAVTPSLEKINETLDGVDVEVRVTLWPSLDQVPNHRDRRVEVPSPEVSKDEIERNLERLREQFASLETADRAAGEGDFVSVDISALADGEPVTEAEAREILYEVGSGKLFEGADERLLGTSAGDSVTFDSALPSGFRDRAGESVTFTVKVNEVKRKVLPELDDEWVSEVTEFETVDQLWEELGREVEAVKRRSSAAEFRRRAIDQLVDQVDLELPEALIRVEMDDIFHRFAHSLEQQDITVDDYFRATGTSQDDFLADLRAQAERAIKTRLLLEEVARVEGLEVTGEELGELIEALVSQSDQPQELLRAFQQPPQVVALRGDILRNKALDAIIAGATPVDEDGKPVDLTEAEVEAEVVEGEPVEAELVEAEIVADEEIEDATQ